MSLQSADSEAEDKAYAYDFFLPSERVYQCVDGNPSAESSRGNLTLDSYELLAVGQSCAYVIYRKSGIIYVVFKGTNNAESVRQDVNMSVTNRWKRFWSGFNVTERYHEPEFMSRITGEANQAVSGIPNSANYPHRYTGHSLGGALALAAYTRYGRDKDECQVFSPYMNSFIATQIIRHTKVNPISVWANQHDPVWIFGKGNYEVEWLKVLTTNESRLKKRLNFLRERKLYGRLTEDEENELPVVATEYREAYRILDQHEKASRSGEFGPTQVGCRIIWYDTSGWPGAPTTFTETDATHYLETMKTVFEDNWKEVNREQELQDDTVIIEETQTVLVREQMEEAMQPVLEREQGTQPVLSVRKEMMEAMGI